MTGGGRGRDEVLAQLSTALRTAMAERGWSQADLARKANVPANTLSNAVNGKSAPSSSTFIAILDALFPDTKNVSATRLHSSQEAERRAQQLRRTELAGLRDRAARRTSATGAPSLPSSALSSYLTAARLAAQEHPYLGIQRGPTPPLSTVYLRQYTRLCTPQTRQGQEDPYRPDDMDHAGPLLPAVEALARGDRICTVVGAPGSGKSSLLRHHLATVIGQPDSVEEGAAVPILVPAAELADGLRLPEALARYANRELIPFGLDQDLKAGFFTTHPKPGAVWLVLVDGLDEILETLQRRRVLTTMVAALADPRGLYRFVVTTRPLPEDELDRLGTQAPRYELRPFAAQELPLFAEGWFAAQQLPAPTHTAELFTAALERSGIVDLARTPLMATMLCQLFINRPDESLPESRGQIYRRFVDLLQENQYNRVPEHQAARALAKYGKAARKRAQHTTNMLPRLIRHLAHQRHSGNTDPALRILTGHPDAQRPEAVPQTAWEDFLTGCLRGSGVLLPRVGDFAFLHHTILEHLAARHAADNARTYTETFDALLRETRNPGFANGSYLGFLLEASDEHDSTRPRS